MSFESRQAVPDAGVVELVDDGKLAFDGSSWKHLKVYLKKIESLPAALGSGSAVLDEAVDRARSEVEAFGSPRRLRRIVGDDPDALAGEEPPATSYAAVVWLGQRLHVAAAHVVSSLRTLMEPKLAGADRRQGLQGLGGEARDARAEIAPVAEVLASSGSRILDADRRLSAACRAAAADLESRQETVGGLQAEIEGLREKIDGLGFFHKKKQRELEERLASLGRELAERSARAEALRAALSQAEQVVDEGHWLGQGIDDLERFLDRLSEVWTAFGSRMAQLAVDAPDDQLEDDAWLSRALGLEEAVEQWQRIDRAARAFVTGSLVDVTEN